MSSLLVERANGLGILTDRDLRSRVLAMGRSPDTVISEVLTSPVITVPAETMVAEVIALMFERGVHHVPVTDGSGQVLGIVTDTDLMGLEQKTPFALKADIERAVDAPAVTAAARGLPETVCALVEANVDPIAVGHVIAVAIDTLTRRFLELGIRKIGDPPCPWSWLALGSEARSEQALSTDQDNALVLDPGDAPSAWWTRTSSGLRRSSTSTSRAPASPVPGGRDRLEPRVARHDRRMGGPVPPMDAGPEPHGERVQRDRLRLSPDRRSARGAAGARQRDQDGAG